MTKAGALITGLAKAFGLGRVVGLAFLVGFVAVRVWDPAPLEIVRNKIFDVYQVISPRVPKPAPVVIVDIDEESLAALGQWPWPRTQLADLVTKISALGGAVVAFDIIFAEPDRLSPSRVVDAIQNLDEATRTRLKSLPSNDRVLAEKFASSRVVVGQSGYNKKLARGAEVVGPKLPLAAIGGDPKPNLVWYPGLLQNLPELEAAAKGRGLITIRPDRDGIVRRVPTVTQAQGRIIPSLSVEVLRVATGGGPLLIRSDGAGITGIAIAGQEIPTDANAQLWIHFTPHDPKRYVAAKSILDGTIKPERIAGHLVLVGTSAIGLHDVKSTPIDPVMPGVEIHAQVLESILTKSYLARPAYTVGAEVIMAIAIGLLIIWILPIFRPWVVLVFGASLAVSFANLSWYFYDKEGILIDVAYPMASTFMIYWAMVFTNYLREERQRREIRGAFSQYLSPALVEQLAKDPEKLVLGGASRETSVLFTDVRGFTSIAELYKDDPQGLTRLMNGFLTPLSKVVIDHKGTIDKYMGDAIMAFWNAPLDDPVHAINACGAALEMLERLKELNRRRVEEAADGGMPYMPLDVGIGINTGQCVVGNMGSDLRFDYSVMGDSVNLASRLEGQSKSYGVPIIVGSRTAALVQDKFAVMQLDAIRVKGKEEPETIHTVLGQGDVMQMQSFTELKSGMADMLSLYRSRAWLDARQAIRDCRSIDSGFGLDALFTLYEARIEAFQQTPPPDDWDGVYTSMTK